MPKTKVYEQEFKKKIVWLYLEEGCTIKSLNEEYQLGDGTVCKWVWAFREECEIDPDLNDTKMSKLFLLSVTKKLDRLKAAAGRKSNRQETPQRWNYLPVHYFLKRSECEPVSIKVSVKISFSMR